MINTDKLIKAVITLIKCTQNNAIEWELLQGRTKNTTMYEYFTKVKDGYLRLVINWKYEPTLEFLNCDGVKEFEFPNIHAITDLFTSIIYPNDCHKRPNEILESVLDGSLFK